MQPCSLQDTAALFDEVHAVMDFVVSRLLHPFVKTSPLFHAPNAHISGLISIDFDALAMVFGMVDKV